MKLLRKKKPKKRGTKMLDICLLGCGGMMPLPYRHLTSLMARYNGKGILIDCGEGTQVSIKEKGWSIKPLDVICFTHYHGDHISGLPGLLLTLGNAERTEPLTMIGPKGLERVVNALRVIAPELPFPIEFVEISGNSVEIQREGYRIQAFKVNHNVTCYGYNIIIDRAGKFDIEKATALEIPKQCWGILQKGETVEVNGRVITSQDVLGPARKGIKVTYCTDTRPVDNIVEHAKDADLFICEGMYGEEGKEEKAKEYKHMTFYEAAELAKKANVAKMWLTHYSPSLVRPEEYMGKVKEIFKNSVAGKDRKTCEIDFSND